MKELFEDFLPIIAFLAFMIIVALCLRIIGWIFTL